jgi:hypothetical protein
LFYVASSWATRVITGQRLTESDSWCRTVTHSIINDGQVDCISACFGSLIQA